MRRFWTYGQIRSVILIVMLAGVIVDIEAYSGIGCKRFMGYLSAIITFAGYELYIASMYRKGERVDRQIRPHPFSWLSFGFLTGTGWLIQVAGGGQAGSWCLGITALFCFLIAGLSFRKYSWKFDRSDWLWVATSALLFVFYLSTKNLMLSAILAILADLAGYGPTIRKAWRKPGTDNPVSFVFNSIKCIPALFALHSYSWATCAYLVMLVLANGGVAVLILVRRIHVAQGLQAS